MLDVIYVITTGGKILFKQSFEDADKVARRVRELAEFMRSAFLSQRPEGEKRLRLGRSIYSYIYDRANKLIYVCVYSEECADWNFDDFLVELQSRFAATEPAEKNHIMFEALMKSFHFEQKGSAQ